MSNEDARPYWAPRDGTYNDPCSRAAVEFDAMIDARNAARQAAIRARLRVKAGRWHSRARYAALGYKISGMMF